MFIYSEKATYTWKISQNSVTFSEYTNFNTNFFNAISDRFWPFSVTQSEHQCSAAMVLQFTISLVMMFPSHSCQFVSSNCETNNWQKVSFPNLYPTLRSCHFCQFYWTFYSFFLSSWRWLVLPNRYWNALSFIIAL